MVRLKATKALFAAFTLIKFQFQNGTIKRSVVLMPIENNYTFQFQNGTIKSGRQGRFLDFGNEFQFQNGTIKSKR